MLRPSFLLFFYALCASASWVFEHDFQPEERSLLFGTGVSLLKRRQEEGASSTSASDSVLSVAGGGGGRGSGGRPRPTLTSSTQTRTTSIRPTSTRTRTRTRTSSTTRTRTSTSTTSTPTATATGTTCAGNTPDTRREWCNYSIDTNYHEITPDTGVVREYWLELDEITVSPDGISRPAVAVNGTIPGPTIFADWGDEVVVHIKNNLHETLNGSTIHWHGIRQLNTNEHDGVVSITQCPITPDHEYTYRWRAQQYGTTWYHSHISLQAWDGVVGPIIINGPATENYDIDAGTIFLNDWTHQTFEELFWYAQTVGPPLLNNSLINGTGVYGSGSFGHQAKGQKETGERFSMKVEEGTSYRLRLINGAIDTHYKFMIDDHELTVIAMDLVPVKPYKTTAVSLAMGQRYDVIVTANQRSKADSFWLRSIPQQSCSDIEDPGNIRGIFYYGNRPSTPTTEPFPFEDSCMDEPMASLVPHVARDVQPPDYQNNALASVAFNEDHFFRWFLNSTTMQVFWEDPTLLQILNGDDSFENSSAVIELPNANEWVYMIVNTTIPVSHPIHLHGHDFFVLAQGTNPWDGKYQTSNPPRRDTAVLPGNGYLVMAWETDNPGAWLMHCHIGWHTTEGFALQFVERIDEIRENVDRDFVVNACNTWNGYDEEYGIEQYDSGV
ncbi:multicopper oxidase-domain-containing protein [Aspergillus nidulans var. acristatus]